MYLAVGGRSRFPPWRNRSSTSIQWVSLFKRASWRKGRVATWKGRS